MVPPSRWGDVNMGARGTFQSGSCESQGNIALQDKLPPLVSERIRCSNLPGVEFPRRRDRAIHGLGSADECRTGIVIVDHDDQARVTLEDILESSGQYRCVGSFANGEQADEQVIRISPQLIVMGIRTAEVSDIECTRRWKCVLPRLTIVLLSARADTEMILRASEAGADGCLTKPFTIAQCLVTVGFALRRNSSSAFESPHCCAVLTQRENEVMRYFAEGLLYKEIADRMGLSYSAVHKHQHNAFVKLRVANRTEAICKWRHLLAVPPTSGSLNNLRRPSK
jgi:DNA-binding NarL/FixJ family response regulator